MSMRGPLRLIGLLFLISLSVAGASASGAPATAPARRPSVKDSPGYIPLVDPESASVRIGRRTNAPLVSARFKGGARGNLDSLGRAILWALHHSETDSLQRLCITDTEFRDILWREFPQSRPATGIQWEDAWRTLYARVNDGCNMARREYGGHYYQFVKFRADSVARYKNFTLYSGLTLVAKDDVGKTHEWTWIRGVAERKGRLKIYSTTD